MRHLPDMLPLVSSKAYVAATMCDGRFVVHGGSAGAYFQAMVLIPKEKLGG